MKDADDSVETYADHPRSISEIRSERSENGADWTPRDVLISLLRDIDSGKTPAPTAIFIAYGVIENGATRAAFSQAGSSVWETLGLIEAAKFSLWENS